MKTPTEVLENHSNGIKAGHEHLILRELKQILVESLPGDKYPSDGAGDEDSWNAGYNQYRKEMLAIINELFKEER